MGIIKDHVFGPPKRPSTEPETRRIIVANEPPPTVRQEIKSWMDEGTIPHKLAHMDEKMGDVFNRVKKFKQNPQDSQFINKKAKKYGDPNNIDEMFNGTDQFTIKQKRRR